MPFASVIACAGVTTAVVINLTESLWIGVAAGLLLGILCGLVNGFVIAKLKINALITENADRKSTRLNSSHSSPSRMPSSA